MPSISSPTRTIALRGLKGRTHMRGQDVRYTGVATIDAALRRLTLEVTRGDLDSFVIVLVENVENVGKFLPTTATATFGDRPGRVHDLEVNVYEAEDGDFFTVRADCRSADDRPEFWLEAPLSREALGLWR